VLAFHPWQHRAAVLPGQPSPDFLACAGRSLLSLYLSRPPVETP
jgi:hypothetical protein